MPRLAWNNALTDAALGFGEYGLSTLSPAITERLTVDTTPGFERFRDSSNRTYRFVGDNIAFNAAMPRTSAVARQEAINFAARNNMGRFMFFDSFEPFILTGARCGWWNKDPRTNLFPLPLTTGTLASGAARNDVALDQFNRFIGELKSRRVRGVMAFDHLGYVLQGMGVPLAGGPDRYRWRGHYWLAAPLAAIKTYLTFIFGTVNPYTGLTWGNDPFWHGLTLQNEQSTSRGYNDGSTTDGFDRIFTDNRTAARDEIQAMWQAFWNLPANNWGVAPKWPSRQSNAAATAQGHPTMAAYTVENRQRWSRFCIDRERYLGQEIKAHLATVAPGLLFNLGTVNFGQFPGQTVSDYQSAHYYVHTGTSEVNASAKTSTGAALTITSAAVVNSVSGGTRELAITVSGTPETPLAAGCYVGISGAGVGSAGGTINGTLGPVSKFTTTTFSVITTLPLQTFPAGGTVNVSADLKYNFGQSILANNNLGSYVVFIGGVHLAGKVMMGHEQEVKGVSRRDLEHPLTLATLSLLAGWAGYLRMTWGVGTSNYGRGSQRGDLDTINLPGRAIGDYIARLMMEHSVIGGGGGGVVIGKLTDAYYATKSATSGGIIHASYYPELGSSGDWARPLHNNAGKRLRMQMDPTVTDVTAARTTLGTAGLGGSAGDIFTFGNPFGKPRWLKSPAPPENGAVSDNERLEWNEKVNPKHCGVVGRIHNGTYGKITISGLPATGWYGLICWTTRDGNPLGQGKSVVAAVGMSCNANFAYVGPNERYYLSYAIGSAQSLDVPDCTVTLNITGMAAQRVDKLDANWVGTEYDASPTATTLEITPWASSSPLYMLTPATVVTTSSTATITGSGTVTAKSPIRAVGTITGTGAVTARAPRKAVGTIAGTALLIGRPYAKSTISMTGTGTFRPVPIPMVASRGIVTGSCTVTAVSPIGAAATVTGSASVSATAPTVYAASALLTGTGSFAAVSDNAGDVQTGDSLIVGNGTLAAVGESTAAGTFLIEAESTVQATALPPFVLTAELIAEDITIIPVVNGIALIPR